MAHPREMYAVVVRDGSELFLVLRIHRSPRGEVFVLIPRDNEPGWDPHVSRHADGREHHKSYGFKCFTRVLSKPNPNFVGVDAIITIPIASDEPRKLNIGYDPAKFTDAFEIRMNDLRPEHFRSQLVVDLVEPGVPRKPYSGEMIVRQKIFNSGAPQIVIALVEEVGAPPLP